MAAKLPEHHGQTVAAIRFAAARSERFLNRSIRPALTRAITVEKQRTRISHKSISSMFQSLLSWTSTNANQSPARSEELMSLDVVADVGQGKPFRSDLLERHPVKSQPYVQSTLHHHDLSLRQRDWSASLGVCTVRSLRTQYHLFIT